ncbi:MAG: DUF3604 domain-containing protein [Spirochaetaceae bacterium]|nr:DUF3604 domain-containing protein [Myxococcales bacterium]MCB9725420.1 DUF3604 domain-containing protein [Spirochaetaceae bacterium]
MVPRASRPAEREVYFGDLHVHSSWSIDAFGAGVRAEPGDAYRYAKGEPIRHATGATLRLSGPPLDFLALTDHAEYLGVIPALSIPGHPLHRQPLIQRLLGEDRDDMDQAWRRIQDGFRTQRGLPALMDDAVVRPAWNALVEIANAHDDPGRFTAFVGFEYSPHPQGQNLHRNVIFRGDRVPERPFSAMEDPDPESLWRWMDRARSEGDDLLAIPHNANGSNGLMFARTRTDGGPIDAHWAETRLRNEPLVEVFQIKGQSETRPALSPEDEWADFEVVPWQTVRARVPSEPVGSYAREALTAGLEIEARVGTNPYAFGLVGSTDGHNAASTVDEADYPGKIGFTDGTPERRLRRTEEGDDAVTATFWGAAGLAGVWADANTRADLFDAMRRREVFATSGPRLRVRVFGGWDFTTADLGPELARAGYARGVPMGGRLARGADPDAAPTFLVAAQKDPREAPIERIQIVKGWLDEDGVHERVYDVACGDGGPPDAGTRRCTGSIPPPDLSTCEPKTSGGAAELRAVWRDPDHDPRARAFYYARVLQGPTCRWSTWDALRSGLPRPEEVPAVIQERALSSPIWVGLHAGAGRQASKGLPGGVGRSANP